ncbi:chorismate-pyruvate lyase [Amycolatopsis bartoniae]|uniref:Chorismate lyase n=1 Tax=Amycolatopsis bartoniae TaxID=941986 RepID=A0A8H9MCC1_9PSEU|nr:hypothetical protein [Amycolatopsis bartoniae]MBB2938016.1 chorismate-pyruvate lyase [Amycolatopsis bartoniae]GHF42354.1 hypothetical protein GCM10017566_14930 [Amycolatopsis bartoniae]
MRTLSQEEHFRTGVSGDFATGARRFHSAATRLLLSGDGLTTTMLEAWARGPMCLVSRNCRLAFPVPPDAEELLRVRDRPVLVRESALADPGGRIWSVNSVVANLDLNATAARCFTGAEPLGAALKAAGVACRRTMVRAGRRPWSGEPAAFRTYVLWFEDQPLAAIRETFNPALVDAGLAETP